MNLRVEPLGLSDDKAGAAGILLSNQLESGRHVFEAFNQDVLQQLAEARFDCPLVARLDFDEIRQRAHLPDPAVGIYEHHARRVRKSGAMRVDLFERPEPPGDRRQLCSRVRTSRARHSCSMRALDSSNSREARAMRAASRLSWARCTLQPRRVAAILLVSSSAASSRASRPRRHRPRPPVRAGPGGFERGAERGNRVDDRVEISALALHVLLGGFDILLRAGVVVCRRRGERGRFVARGGRFRRRRRRASSASRSGSRRGSSCCVRPRARRRA